MHAFINSPSDKMPGVVEYILWSYLHQQKAGHSTDSIIITTLANDMKPYDFGSQTFNREIQPLKEEIADQVINIIDLIEDVEIVQTDGIFSEKTIEAIQQ